jgi:hypothetical protein
MGYFVPRSQYSESLGRLVYFFIFVVTALLFKKFEAALLGQPLLYVNLHNGWKINRFL